MGEKHENAYESIANNHERCTDDAMDLMEVYSNYEFILDKFETKITTITYHRQNFFPKQLY